MFKGSKRFFAAGILFSLLAAFLDMVTPKLVQYTVDGVLGSDELPETAARILNALGGRELMRERLWIIALAVAAVALLAAACRYFYRMCNIMGTERVIKGLRDRLFDHILHLPASWHDKNHTGDIIQRCTSDVETIRNFMSEQMTALFRIVILIVLALVFMFGIDTKLALVSAAFIPVVILYSLFFHKKIGNAFLHADEEEGKLSAIAQENLTGVRVVRAFGRERTERERFETKNQSYTKLWIRLMGWLSAFWCSNDFITGLQMGLITVLGAVFCVRGSLSVGEYIAFASYHGMLIWPVRELGRVISDMSRVGISLSRVRFILDSDVEDEEDHGDVVLSGDIVFDHVSFSYPDGPKVLDDVSFTVKAGTTLGILGGTGAGKSTLMALLLRLYELAPDGGHIRIGDKDIRDIPLHELRSHVGLVLQETYLFSRTLRENIAITVEDEADEKMIKEAVETADLGSTIERFTDKDETFVGERGVTLSGGQKQRVAIARMLMKKPSVYIFDDSLSAVDIETDARIRASLKKYMEEIRSESSEASKPSEIGAAGGSLILISHRITTLMQADCIMVMEKGRIAESGTHEELLKKKGIYSKIFDIQTEGKNE
ncbi:MAG: ABC transporter ATP-binding protein [Lachnospiraceae bacterium]|nr:ABC transporter ATP-binding protein [Lachnospiraceae bacterium]